MMNAHSEVILLWFPFSIVVDCMRYSGCIRLLSSKVIWPGRNAELKTVMDPNYLYYI